jgi:hypothetical protein
MITTSPQTDPHGLTKNQHFVSQAEQRLNALNPSARPENQRIYEFKIVDRDKHKVQLVKPNGRLISNSLSMFDLFSSDIGDNGARANLERVFGTYEAKIRELTAQVLRAHAARSSAVNHELFDLFVAKMVNFIRNPFSVAKVLNTFGVMGQHHPADPQIYAEYERILTGRRPQQAYLCNKLGISDDQYGAWLRVLFMLLTPLADGQVTMLEQALRSLFEGRDHALHIHLHTYSTERCLLSDRGWTVPVPEDRHLVFDFNLTAQAFIRYAFLDYEAALGYPLPPIIRQGLSQGPKVVQLFYLHDDFVSLGVFHRRIIEQSFERVFSSGLSPYSVTVTGSAQRHLRARPESTRDSSLACP